MKAFHAQTPDPVEPGPAPDAPNPVPGEPPARPPDPNPIQVPTRPLHPGDLPGSNPDTVARFALQIRASRAARTTSCCSIA